MQPQILNILDIMKDLVSVQSDTGTKMGLSGSPLISGKIPIFPFIRITGALPIRTTFWAAVSSGH